ncbi:MAG: hypothetical protein RI907_3274 [Pseudomonadota bacterium]|jgi:AcrR family transcriptional regulator
MDTTDPSLPDADLKPASSGRVYRGMNPDERAADRRARLMEAGLHLFGTKGLGATTMRELAAVARVRMDQTTAMYGSKEALFIELHKSLAREVRQAIAAQIMAKGIGDEDLRLVLKIALVTYFEYLKAHPQPARILIQEGGQLGLDDPTNVHAYIGKYVDPLRLHFRKRFPQSYKLVDYQVMLSGLAGYVVSACRCWMGRNFDLTPQEVADHCMFNVMGLVMWLEAHELAAGSQPRGEG